LFDYTIDPRCPTALACLTVATHTTLYNCVQRVHRFTKNVSAASKF